MLKLCPGTEKVCLDKTAFFSHLKIKGFILFSVIILGTVRAYVRKITVHIRLF